MLSKRRIFSTFASTKPIVIVIVLVLGFSVWLASEILLLVSKFEHGYEHDWRGQNTRYFGDITLG
jgi:hypothetical protein